MLNILVKNRLWVRTLLLILGLIPLLSGISGLVGWIFDQELLTSFRPGLVPMPPSTAVLFTVLSLVYILHLHGDDGPTQRAIIRLFSFMVLLTSLTLLTLSLLKIQLDIEYLGLSMNSGYLSGTTGHMSPVSALLFFVLSINFMIVKILRKTVISMVIPAALSGFALLLSAIFFIGYLIGKPLLYGMNVVPPSLNTTFSFLALSVAFMIESFFKEKEKVDDAVYTINERFKNAFENSAEGKSMIYIDGTFQVNKAFAEMLGYSISELSQLSWKPVTHPDDQQLSQQIMDRLVHETVESARFEKRYIHKNGQIVWVDLQTYLQRDQSGKPLYYITSASDITASKAMREQLIIARDLAERSNQLKDAFIANMSHEIRTPLNAILGFSDLLRDELSTSGSTEYESYFDIIRSSGTRLMRTVDMILNVSRLQVGAYEIRPVRIKLNKMIHDLVSEYRLPATSKGLSIEFQNQLDNPTILADEYCVLHAISNLIDNAVKYTRSGNINLTLYSSQSNAICLDVKDTGIGISEEFLTEIFNPFTQEEMSSTRKFEGIGLGLSIAHRMLAATGSKLTVKSTKGIGTTFTITFPLQ